MRIAIVNDMPLAVEALRRALAFEPAHQVIWVASNGAEAVQRCAEQTPDLILMDIQLPGMDGLTATALLKTDPVTAGIPVIALTAMAMKADREKSQAAGCEAYFAKPLRYQELYAAIDALLPKARQQAARPEN